jgi:hypothetical protein
MAQPDCRATIRALRDEPTGRTGDELAAILVEFGFKGEARKVGLNVAFTHDGSEVIPTFPPGTRPIKKIYVTAVIAALREICDE